MTREELIERYNNGQRDFNCVVLKGANLIRANLADVNLTTANLEGVCLRWANLRGANLRGANLECADLRGANLEGACLKNVNLRRVILTGADLREANLEGAILDYSCLPLWCGSLSAYFDDKQLIQIAYHLVKAGLNSPNASDRIKNELSKLIDIANEFPRVGECGKIERR